MENNNLLNTESVVVASDAYIQGLQMKYDFYKDIIGILFLIGVGFILFLVVFNDRHDFWW